MQESTKSSGTSKPNKPVKPYDGFPLFPHATRRWAKKIRGKFHYFGPWGNPQAALVRFNREWPYLSEGRTPPAAEAGDGCNFSSWKFGEIRLGERKGYPVNDLGQ